MGSSGLLRRVYGRRKSDPLGHEPQRGYHKANYIGTGMHGEVIYIRGKVEHYQLGKEVVVFEPEKEDWKALEGDVKQFASYFGFDGDELLTGKFTKLVPVSKRPYGKIYAY